MAAMIKTAPQAPGNFIGISALAGAGAWVFDLDNTLYPASSNLFAQIDERMGDFIARHLGVTGDQAQKIRKSYFIKYGTTLWVRGETRQGIDRSERLAHLPAAKPRN